MSKKDYEALAAALNAIRPKVLGAEPFDLEIGKTVAWQASCIAIADACSSLSPRFDRTRFLAACHAE